MDLLFGSGMRTVLRGIALALWAGFLTLPASANPVILQIQTANPTQYFVFVTVEDDHKNVLDYGWVAPKNTRYWRNARYVEGARFSVRYEFYHEKTYRVCSDTLKIKLAGYTILQGAFSGDRCRIVLLRSGPVPPPGQLPGLPNKP